MKNYSNHCYTVTLDFWNAFILTICGGCLVAVAKEAFGHTARISPTTRITIQEQNS
ncbi:hypothetical protein PO124_28055 [Bacillus licheniformis]|nr:hypothetical protein [Bacillus licheniformis]